MSTLITNNARAYVNHGRWVADCPFDCGSARKLEPGEYVFQCSECLSVSRVEWPSNADDIWEALAERRAPKFRNWFPSNHTLALRSGTPHGQTPAELREEADAHKEQ